jgi:hypothetical protein
MFGPGAMLSSCGGGVAQSRSGGSFVMRDGSAREERGEQGVNQRKGHFGVGTWIYRCSKASFLIDHTPVVNPKTTV